MDMDKREIRRSTQAQFNTSEIQRLGVRMPKRYHDSLTKISKREGISLNYLMIEAIESLLKKRGVDSAWQRKAQP